MYKIVLTKDGSHTIISPITGDTYHSMGGAISESHYVYIENGFLFKQNSLNYNRDINILEIGFGTGLNCFLTRLNQQNHRIKYTALEPYPLPNQIINNLNYKEILNKETKFFDLIHKSKINFEFDYKDEFYFEFINQRLEYYKGDKKFDIIYYDGFAKSKDSKIWGSSNIYKLTNLLTKEGIMVTYASNTYIKKELKSCGFEYEVLPGALGKREMLRVSW